MGLMNLLSRKFTLILAACVLLGTAFHLWTERYFLRFIPLPLAMVDSINSHSVFTPAYQDGVLKGQVGLPKHDMKTPTGLRDTLNAIRAFSPLVRANGIPSYADITFEKWLNEIRTKPLLCTDATQLLIATAWAQGLKAREWHLLPPGWPPGQGHSVAEFLNPDTGKWQVVDAQHAAIIRDRESGESLDMVEVLKRYRSGRSASIDIDYGPYTDFFTKPGNPGPTATYFFKSQLLSTPVLQLRQATWFASYAQKFLISGHFVIGYPIVFDGWKHRGQIFWTKISFLLFAISGLLLLIGGWGAWRQHSDRL
jgi:hypothetical protein